MALLSSTNRVVYCNGPAPVLALLASLLLALQLAGNICESLRTGAPALACISLRPFHGLNRGKPASASQFFVTQSALTYAPGQNITVDVATHSNERYFRGFMVQAYDPTSGRQIGRFLQTTESRPIDSCSSATHRSNLNKKFITLTWLPPGGGGASAASSQQHNNVATQTPSTTSTAATNTTNIGGLISASDFLTNLGFRPPRFPLQPSLTYSVNSKRQFPTTGNSLVAPTLVASSDGDDTATANPSDQQSPPSPPPSPSSSALAANNDSNLRQVRFRATIVVTYEDFYTGFESSDQSFERFDYATTTKPATRK